jgi:hypothetical protein
MYVHDSRSSAPLRTDSIWSSCLGNCLHSPRVLECLAFVGFSFIAVITYCPFNPCMFSDGLSESWVLALNIAFADGLRFGKDILYSYGPWGFLYGGLSRYVPMYYPETFGYLLCLRVFLSLSFLLLLWFTSKFLIRRPWIRYVWICAVFFMIDDPFTYPFVFLLVILHFFHRPILSFRFQILPVISLALVTLTNFWSLFRRS